MSSKKESSRGEILPEPKVHPVQEFTYELDEQEDKENLQSSNYKEGNKDNILKVQGLNLIKENSFECEFTSVLQNEPVSPSKDNKLDSVLRDNSGECLSPVINLPESPSVNTETSKFMFKSPEKLFEVVWESHSKKIEAFCTECKETLCIDCILSE